MQQAPSRGLLVSAQPATLGFVRLISIKPLRAAVLYFSWHALWSPAEDMHLARAIFVLVVALSLAMLPAAGAFASVAKHGSSAVSESMSDCAHHSGQDRSNDKADHTSCAVACAGMCWGQSNAAAYPVQFTLLGGSPIPQIVSDDATGPHDASPPFRPPRL